MNFTDSDIVLNVAYLLIGAAVFLLARTLMREEQSRAAEDQLEDRSKSKAKGSLVQMLRPFYTQYVLPFVRSRPFWENQRRHYKRKIIAAGLRDELNSDELISFKIILIVFFPLVGGLLRALEFVDVSTFTILGSGVAGWFYPDFWMKGRIEKRQREILKTLPFVVDLLALSTEAGLDFINAIGKVVEKAQPGPLVEELAQVLKEIQLGSARSEALREMGLRIDMTEVSSFIAILISAEQSGSSVSKILRQQSDQIRTQRVTRAEKAGARAASQVMIPVVLFIVPAVMLMVFGPFVLTFVN